jgi:saccharopine dehydrogenase (NADP+, L-glutamate forming)
VQLGATDDTYQMEAVDKMSHREFINSFLFYNPGDSVELKLAHALNLDLDGEIMHKLRWLGIFSHEAVGLQFGTPAQILEHILRKKWTLSHEERDMIVMWHKFDFQTPEGKKEIQSHMVVIGDDQKNTAMAKTVGLPLGIATKLILTDRLSLRGLSLPIEKSVYEPVLEELQNAGISFQEREMLVTDEDNKQTSVV